MLDAAVAREVEDRGLAEHGRVEIAGVNEKLVVLGLGFRDDLAVRVDDQTAAEQWEAILDAGFRASHDPLRVLAGAALHRPTPVPHPLPPPPPPALAIH